MIVDKELKEILSAYALGCMDKRNLDHFKEYLEIEGDLPKELLSDFINLSALIPTILTLENPDVKLKETVAKNLLSLREEVEAKIKQKNLETAAKTQNGESNGSDNEDEIQDKNELEQKPFEESSNFATLSTKTTLFSQDDYHRGSKESEEYVEQQSNVSPFNLFNFILASVVIVILVVFGYYFFNMNKTMNNQIEKLNTQVAELNIDLAYSKEFISKYEKLINFFNYSDIKIIPLAGTEASISSSGRLFISQEGREALIEIKNLPILKNTEAYFLWVVGGQQSYVLSSFVPKTGERYISIPEFPVIPLDEIDLVILTNEPRSGSETPQGTTYLFGSVKKEIKK